VLTDCLSYALETGQDADVGGGTSEQERRAAGSTLITACPEVTA
jgi:hypothetical protein